MTAVKLGLVQLLVVSVRSELLMLLDTASVQLLHREVVCCITGRIVNDVVPTSVECLTNTTSSHSPRDHVRLTVHMSEDGICSRLRGKVGKGPDTEDMVTVAIRINTDTLQNIKVRTSARSLFFFIHRTIFIVSMFDVLHKSTLKSERCWFT